MYDGHRLYFLASGYDCIQLEDIKRVWYFERIFLMHIAYICDVSHSTKVRVSVYYLLVYILHIFFIFIFIFITE